MKKILISLLGLGALTVACQANEVVYKMILSDTTIGNGLTTLVKSTGYLVIDFNGADMAIVQVFANKHFSIAAPTNFAFGPVNGSLGSQSFGLAFSEGTAGSIGAFGKQPAAGVVPKTMVVSGVVLSGSGPSVLDEFKGSLAFDSTDSATANNLNEALADTETRLENFLESKGYIFDGIQSDFRKSTR